MAPPYLFANFQSEIARTKAKLILRLLQRTERIASKYLPFFRIREMSFRRYLILNYMAHKNVFGFGKHQFLLEGSLGLGLDYVTQIEIGRPLTIFEQFIDPEYLTFELILGSAAHREAICNSSPLLKRIGVAKVVRLQDELIKHPHQILVLAESSNSPACTHNHLNRPQNHLLLIVANLLLPDELLHGCKHGSFAQV